MEKKKIANALAWDFLYVSGYCTRTINVKMLHAGISLNENQILRIRSHIHSTVMELLNDLIPKPQIFKCHNNNIPLLKKMNAARKKGLMSDFSRVECFLSTVN